MSTEPDTVPVGTLARAKHAIDQHAARIQRLEEAEQRLRVQDPTYCDPRIATSYKGLFEMLTQLHALEGFDQGDDDSDPQTSEASARDVEAADVLLARLMAQLIIKTRPNFSGLKVEVDSVEDDWRRQLGDRGHR